MPSSEEYRDAANRCRLAGEIAVRQLRFVRCGGGIDDVADRVTAEAVRAELSVVAALLLRSAEAAAQLAALCDDRADRMEETVRSVAPWWTP